MKSPLRPRRLRRGFFFAALATVLAAGTTAQADDAYYCVPLSDLKITEGQAPADVAPPTPFRVNWRLLDFQRPYVVIDGCESYAGTPAAREGEVSPQLWNNDWGTGQLYIKAPAGKAELSGILTFPNLGGSGMDRLRFTLTLPKADDEDAQLDFQKLQWEHYSDLLDRRIPGGAWFRHQLTEIPHTGEIRITPRGWRRGNFSNPDDELMSLFSGSRAVSENLQLDRALVDRSTGGAEQAATVEVDSIPGITVPEIDWKERIQGLDPKLDPLATSVPYDQHVVFFSSYEAVRAVADMVDQQDIMAMGLAYPRSEDQLVRQRYEQQLGLSLSALSRLLGPQVLRSIALTGSDSYFAAGTDVAVLLEPVNATVVSNLLNAQIILRSGFREPEKGEIAGVPYLAYVSPDRRISSYLATVGDVVVVTNSLKQLERLVATQQGKLDAIAGLDEYRFFRHRYPLEDAGESAFVFLSDATIRRWCSARWRIGDMLRTRQAAVMADYQAQQLDNLVSGKATPGSLEGAVQLPLGEGLNLTPEGVVSPQAGRLDFLTPILELPLDRVHEQDAEIYSVWRESYQRNWRWAFDPIALRLEVKPERLSADLTVMPLIAATRYTDLLDVVGGVTLRPDQGDPHDALFEVILAIDHDSETIRRFGHMGPALGLGVQGNALSWLGDSVSLYIDDGELWQQLSEEMKQNKDAPWKPLEQHMGDFPVYAFVETSSATKLTLFLASLRTLIDGTAPGMLHWETLDYEGKPYVRISPADAARRDLGMAGAKDPSIFYSVSGEGLLIALNEATLKRALDRQRARQEAKAKGEPAPQGERPWLGQSLGMYFNHKFLEDVFPLMNHFSGGDLRQQLQFASWDNLPILNEWHRRYPGKDPLKVHEQFWGTRLVCPGGGKYQWNDQWQTMESTVFGHPGEPKMAVTPGQFWGRLQSAQLGLTFEKDGLRARVVLEQAAKPPAAEEKNAAEKNAAEKNTAEKNADEKQ